MDLSPLSTPSDWDWKRLFVRLCQITCHTIRTIISPTIVMCVHTLSGLCFVVSFSPLSPGTFKTAHVNLMNLCNLLHFGSDLRKLILSSILKDDTESMGERGGRREQRGADCGRVWRHREIVSGWQAPPHSHCAYSSLSVSLLVFLTRGGVKREMRKRRNSFHVSSYIHCILSLFPD